MYCIYLGYVVGLGYVHILCTFNRFYIYRRYKTKSRYVKNGTTYKTELFARADSVQELFAKLKQMLLVHRLWRALYDISDTGNPRDEITLKDAVQYVLSLVYAIRDMLNFLEKRYDRAYAEKIAMRILYNMEKYGTDISTILLRWGPLGIREVLDRAARLLAQYVSLFRIVFTPFRRGEVDIGTGKAWT